MSKRGLQTMHFPRHCSSTVAKSGDGVYIKILRIALNVHITNNVVGILTVGEACYRFPDIESVWVFFFDDVSKALSSNKKYVYFFRVKKKKFFKYIVLGISHLISFDNFAIQYLTT